MIKWLLVVGKVLLLLIFVPHTTYHIVHLNLGHRSEVYIFMTQLEKIVNTASVSQIESYIISPNDDSVKDERLQKLELYESMYDAHYREKKLLYYKYFPLFDHNAMTMKNENTPWILRKLIEIDFDDGLQKYGFLSPFYVHTPT